MKHELLSRIAGISLFAMVFLAVANLPAAQAAGPSGPCSGVILSGSYGFSQEGTLAVLGPATAVGMFTSDGRGSITGTETIAVASQYLIFPDQFTGTYTINPNCTGTLAYIVTMPDGQKMPRSAAFVITGLLLDEIKIMSTDKGDAFAGVARRIGFKTN